MHEQMIERLGEAFELGDKLTVVGSKLAPGDVAPEFELENFDPATSSMRMISLSDSSGKVRLLNIVNSVDTPVCHLETVRWDESTESIPGLALYTVSMDLPFAMARWQTATDVDHIMLSAHANEKFGTDYGVLLKEWRLLQRAVIVISKSGEITHAEYVGDQMTEPDYDAALAAARHAVDS